MQGASFAYKLPLWDILDRQSKDRQVKSPSPGDYAITAKSPFLSFWASRNGGARQSIMGDSVPLGAGVMAIEANECPVSTLMSEALTYRALTGCSVVPVSRLRETKTW